MSQKEKYAEAVIGEHSAHFNAVEVQGVVDHSGEVETDNVNPAFFTTYARHHDGRALAVGDFDERADAVAYANELAEKYGWLRII